MRLLASDHLQLIRDADMMAGEDLQGCPSAWDDRRNLLRHIDALAKGDAAPLPLLLWCPACNQRHVDEGEYAVKPHHTHACQHCGLVWRPAIQPTVGVVFLPGFKNPEPEQTTDG